MIKRLEGFMRKSLTVNSKGYNMWYIELNLITGFMLGIEFITKEQTEGTAAFILDLGIVRLGIYHEDL